MAPQSTAFYLKTVHHARLPKGLEAAKEWDTEDLFFCFIGPSSGSPALEIDAPATKDHKRLYPTAWSNFLIANPQFAEPVKEEADAKMIEKDVHLASEDGDLHSEVVKENEEASDLSGEENFTKES